MRFLEKRRYGFRVLSSVAVALLMLGVFASHPGSAEGERRTKHSSSRKASQNVACDEARESASKLAELDCMTSGGVIFKPEVSKCDCQPMGGKWLCSVAVTYECD